MSIKMWCNSEKCKDGDKLDDRWPNAKVPKGTEQEHEYVSSSLDPKAPKDDKSWMYSSRGIRSDYRTVRCRNCGRISTWDFAKD